MNQLSRIQPYSFTIGFMICFLIFIFFGLGYYHRKNNKISTYLILPVSSIVIFIITFYFLFVNKLSVLSSSEFFTLIIPVVTIMIGFYGAWLAYKAAMAQIENNIEQNKITTDSSLKKQIAINRQNWINQLRSEITNFMTICYDTYKNNYIKNQSSILNSSLKIRLLMNPDDYLYDTINILLAEISCLCKESISNKLLKSNSYRVMLLEVTHCLLKVEWERIKHILSSAEMPKDYYKKEAYHIIIPNSISKETYKYISAIIDAKYPNSPNSPNKYKFRKSKYLTDYNQYATMDNLIKSSKLRKDYIKKQKMLAN